MGSNWSSLEREPSPDPWWPALAPRPARLLATLNDAEEKITQESRESNRGRVKEEELNDFKQELAKKRAIRQEMLSALQSDMNDLREKLKEQTELRKIAEEERDQLRNYSNVKLQKELESEREVKKKLLEERDQLKLEVEEKLGLERQVQALKDVSQIGKEMLRIRELQVKELKKNLVEINLKSVMAPPEDLRLEYEKQIENIRKLRNLYDERAAATLLKHKQELEREEAKITVLETKLSEMTKEIQDYKEAKSELEAKIEKVEKIIEHKNEELEQTKDNLFSCTAQNHSLTSQLTLINNLFSQMLVSPKVDLDRLTRLLKDNHGLITDVTEKGDSNDVAALLVDLAEQVEKEQTSDSVEHFAECAESQSEIASNLSKVWKIMVELLSHHQNSCNPELAGGAESCYKCIQTPSGPRSVISVSKTFLTLRDLILEKNSLVKEVGRLKTLNNHLENRLGSQEKRLSFVTTELKKTWGVVNKLKAQHKQLHTHEKILRYELQQKRCMLTELKEELEHCRDKWDRARQKNSQTEEDWIKLRKEFAARKTRQESNSAESGYEEEDIAHSPPNNELSGQRNYFEIIKKSHDEAELSDEEIEHSDGNSFDTVIDLLDIACLENQVEEGVESPFVVTEVSPQAIDILPSLIPLTNSEFTDGLDQIESEDLAAVLDEQYQNQLIGADYNLSLPSSSSSSPIPTENDDLVSSEIDMSEEDLSSLDNCIQLPSLSTENPPSEDSFLFGSNSSKNVSKFLEGLFDDQNCVNISNGHQNFILTAPSTSQLLDDNESTTPIVNDGICYEFPDNLSSKLDSNGTMCNTTQMETQQCSMVLLNENPNFNSLQSPQVYLNGSNASTSNIVNNSEEDILNAREEKLKKLEKNCRALVNKVMSTSFRSEIISKKLDDLQSCYAPADELSDGDTLIKRNEVVDNNGIEQNYESVEVNCINHSEIDANHEMDNENVDLITLTEIEPNLTPSDNRTSEEVLEARAARLKRLEDQCKSLFSKMSATSSRSEQICNKLDDLHQSYGPNEQLKTKGKHTSRRSLILNSEKQKHNKCLEHLDTTKITDINNVDLIHKSPDIVSESKEILNKCCIAGPSDDVTYISEATSKKNLTEEEILQARSDRFKRLEDQCKSLVSKMTATSLRSEMISNKLDELHSCYGSSEDTSETDEQCSFIKEHDRSIKSPTSSPKHNRKVIQSSDLEYNLKPDGAEGCSTSTKNGNERIELRGTVSMLENNTTDKEKRTPEQILLARAQRLNRLEEQCKSLFTKMSATSQRSDVISNRLEELHEHYSQSPENRTRDRTTLPLDTSSEQNDYERMPEVENTEATEDSSN